jgi:hypothetical protein
MRYREVASPVAGTEGAEALESPSYLFPAPCRFPSDSLSSRLRVFA